MIDLGETIPVIIAGAGPVGLSLALSLARRGVRSVVLEKDASLKPYSRAILIPTRTLEIFREWDILDAFLQAGDFRPDFTVYEARTSQPLMRRCRVTRTVGTGQEVQPIGILQ